MIDRLYAAVARGRRRYYTARPHLRRRLSQPVISIGNLAAGGRAKTPLAALIARTLRDAGERPAILSRGYARRDRTDGVIVVRDPGGIRADLDRAGDEPLMLARQLDGVAVLVSPSRYLAGRLAERHFAASVHVLDDGFQHFDLHRDADLVVVAREDLAGARTLPTGRLREPLDAASAADAFVALDDGLSLDSLHVNGRPVWTARRRLEPIVWGSARTGTPPLLAVAGIADPEGFFQALRRAGHALAGEGSFPDHYAFGRSDVAAVFAAANGAGAGGIVTTEKDYVRLLPFRPFALPVGYAPLGLEIEPRASFEAWLRDRVRQSRS